MQKRRLMQPWKVTISPERALDLGALSGYLSMPPRPRTESLLHEPSCPPSPPHPRRFPTSSLFNAALEAYKRKTKKDLASHPLLPSLQSCDSSEAILTVLRERVPAFSDSQNSDDGLTKWVISTVNVLYSFSATLGGVVGLVNHRMFSREESLF